MITAEEFISEAHDWIGVPFHHQGRNRHGVDCAGLPIAILAENNTLPKGFQTPLRYSRLPTPQLVRQLLRWCVEIPEPIPGALLLIKWAKVSLPSHLAICTGPDLIHAYHSVKGVVKHSFQPPWTHRVVSSWKVCGVNYVE